MPGAALRVSHAEVIHHVESHFATADPVADGRALGLHLLVLCADVAAVQTPGQVVPQLGEVVASAGRAFCGRGGGAVSGQVSARRAPVAREGSACKRVLVIIGGNGL